MSRKKTFRIYRSAWHVAVTLLVVALPFAFLLFFSNLTKLTSAELFTETAISVGRMAVAYVIAAALGWILAIAFYRGRRGDVALPIFDVLQSLPASAALPAAALVWGKTNFTVIFFLTFAIIWPIFFSLVSSLKLLKHEWEESVEIGGLRGWQYVRHFLWPASLPALVTGSIIGLGDGWEALVVTEILVGVGGGLGQFFNTFAADQKITLLGIFGLLLLVFAINKLIWLPLLRQSHRYLEE